MNSMQFHCFLRAAQSLNFTAAASALYINQSTLSKNISSLEEELGIQLFFRDYKSVRLTPGGALLAQKFQELEAQCQGWLRDAGLANQGLTGSLKLGHLAAQHISKTCSDYISAFERRYPEIHVSLCHESFHGLLEQLRSGEIDVAFSATFDVEREEDLAYREMTQVQNLLIIPRQYRFVRPGLELRPGLTLVDFAEETFLSVSSQDSSQMIQRLRESCRQAGFEAHILEAPNFETLLFWMEVGWGISPLNVEHMVYRPEEMRGVELAEFQPITLSAVWLKKAVNPCVSLFVDTITPQS